MGNDYADGAVIAHGELALLTPHGERLHEDTLARFPALSGS